MTMIKTQFDIALDGSYNLSDTNISHPAIFSGDFRRSNGAHLLRGR